MAGNKTHLACFLFFQLLASRIFILNYATSVAESGVPILVVLQKSRRIARVEKSHVLVQFESPTLNGLVINTSANYISYPFSNETISSTYFAGAIQLRAFWCTRTTAKAYHTVTARRPRDGRKNAASAKPHWKSGANPSKRAPLH